MVLLNKYGKYEPLQRGKCLMIGVFSSMFIQTTLPSFQSKKTSKVK